MVDPGTIANVVATIVGVITIGSAIKSVYNGKVSAAIDNLGMIPEVASEVESLKSCVQDVKDEQSEVKQGVVAIARAQQRPEIDVDAGELADELDVEPGPERFFPDDNRYGVQDDD